MARQLTNSISFGRSRSGELASVQSKEFMEFSSKNAILCVPFSDEREVLNLGARYEPNLKCFYVGLDEYLDPFWNWLALRYKKQPALMPEMLPVTTWEDNLRTRFSSKQWDILRKECYRRAGHRCEICGGPGLPQVEAHEQWSFDDDFCVQSLTGLLCLCPLCHKAFHLGFAKRIGLYDAVVEHIKAVNGWDSQILSRALELVEKLAQERSRYHWELDTSWLDNGPLGLVSALDLNSVLYR